MFGIRKYSDQRRPFTIADDNFILRAAMDGWGYQKIASHLKRSKNVLPGGTPIYSKRKTAEGNALRRQWTGGKSPCGFDPRPKALRADIAI